MGSGPIAVSPINGTLQQERRGKEVPVRTIVVGVGGSPGTAAAVRIAAAFAHGLGDAW